MTDGELRQISRPLDLVALNLYSGAYVAADAQHGFRIIQPPKDYPTYNVHWLKHLPDCLYWSLRFAHEKGAKRLYISENGCCATDVPGPDGSIDDVDRVLLLREYLRAASRATSDGVPLQGYFVWTLYRTISSGRKGTPSASASSTPTSLPNDARRSSARVGTAR